MLASTRVGCPSRVVGGHGAAQDHFRLEDLEFCPPDLVNPAQGVIRVEDHQAGDAVEDDQVPGLDLQGGVVQPHHRRNLQGMGDDGGVGGLAAPLGDEPQHLGSGHLGGFRRRQVPGHDDRRLREAERFAGVLAGQAPQQAPVNRLHVRHAPPDVLVADALEQLLNLQIGLVQGPFGVEVLLLDELQGLGIEHPVPQNQQVQLQDMGVLLQILGDFVLEAGQFLFDLLHRLALNRSCSSATSLAV